jgi:hypothetical protein
MTEIFLAVHKNFTASYHQFINHYPHKESASATKFCRTAGPHGNQWQKLQKRQLSSNPKNNTTKLNEK